MTKEIHFCYGHRLLNYTGKCRHLHGHNGKAVVTLQSPELDDLGMVVDFSEVKRVLGQWIDENLDHRVLRGVVEDVQRQSIATIPAARYGEAEEFAAMATFLASNRASYVTGGVIRVDGGLIRSV